MTKGLARLMWFCWWFVAATTWSLSASDQPQWGQAWSRNLASSERNLPDSFDPASGKNIKWSADLGTETHATPVIAGGRVYIGTNNGHPRDPGREGDRGVLMCFDERTGKFLWQLLVPKRVEDIFFDWPSAGICSPVTVEGDRVYLVSNRGEVMCLDAKGMADGNDGPYLYEGAHMDPNLVWLASSNSPLPEPERKLCEAAPKPGPQDADIIWLFELTSGAGIWSHDAAHSSILIRGDFLYLNTGTGVDNTHRKIRTPDAPSLVVLDKKTGRLVARENEHIAPNIFHSTWSSPSLADINGRPILFFAGGNGIVYGFEPLGAASLLGAPAPSPAPVTYLHKLFSFDFDPAGPKENVHKYNGNRRESPSDIFGMPVVYKDRLYVAGGGDIWWGKNQAWVKCLDPAKSGDITTNGFVWSYPLDRHVMATPALADDLLFIVDCPGTLHCVDARTGQPCWTHQLKGDGWASPFVADGKVYLGTRSGEFYVFAVSREKKLLSCISLGSPISSTVNAANGALYVATMNRLYAVGQKPGSAVPP